MNKEFLKYCKYYKGEKTCPFPLGEKYNFWKSEAQYFFVENKSKFENENYISMMTEAAPEIRHITENKSIPIQARAMVAWIIDDIAYHSPMSDTAYFRNYGKD